MKAFVCHWHCRPDRLGVVVHVKRRSPSFTTAAKMHAAIRELVPDLPDVPIAEVYVGGPGDTCITLPGVERHFVAPRNGVSQSVLA